MLAAVSTMAKPIVILSDNKDDYTQTEDGYILKFDLEATSNELALIESRIEPLSDRVKMSTEAVKDNLYSCVYTVTHQNQPEYVHKMMLSCGFQVIQHKGQTYNLNKIIEILYSYQD